MSLLCFHHPLVDLTSRHQTYLPRPPPASDSTHPPWELQAPTGESGVEKILCFNRNCVPSDTLPSGSSALLSLSYLQLLVCPKWLMHNCCPVWKWFWLPPTVEKLLLSLFAIHLNIPLFHKNVCHFELSFEMVVTLAWFSQILWVKYILPHVFHSFFHL